MTTLDVIGPTDTYQPDNPDERYEYEIRDDGTLIITRSTSDNADGAPQEVASYAAHEWSQVHERP
jgi:hypothetical protein